MNIVVTGKEGQLALALARRGAEIGASVLLAGRPELDLERPETIAPALAALSPSIVVNAAAFTAVDQAERERDRAMAINGAGAGHVAVAAAELGVPIIQISTDYVFDGVAPRAYCESDATSPLGVYGESKLVGENLAQRGNPRCAILRVAWLYSPFGKNFVRTMLRLAETRDEIGVVSDQIGSPTSAMSLADIVLAVAGNLLARPGDLELLGIFHTVDAGEASWAEFATAIFEYSAAQGGPSARVRPIATSDYPTPAARPANSRLDTRKLQRAHGVVARAWREQLKPCVEEIVARDYAR